MKTMKLVTAISVTLLLQSCGGGGGKLGTAGGATFAKNTIENNIKPGEDILRISLSGETDGSKIEIIDVYYADAALKNEVKCKSINLLNESMTKETNKSLSFSLVKATMDGKVAGNAKKTQ
jgi:hypothetical protein